MPNARGGNKADLRVRWEAAGDEGRRAGEAQGQARRGGGGVEGGERGGKSRRGGETVQKNGASEQATQSRGDETRVVARSARVRGAVRSRGVVRGDVQGGTGVGGGDGGYGYAHVRRAAIGKKFDGTQVSGQAGAGV